MERKHKSLWLHVAAGLIPLVILLANFALLKAIPFGSNTILMYDANYQYPDFAVYLQSVFAGENDLVYTFSKNMGGEMVSLFCYYLFSPFSILFAFAAAENIPYIFTLVIVLKLCACSVTFCHAAIQRFGCKWYHLIFSTAYALMAYTTLYGWNIMWMDGVIVLPLLALGLERLWKGQKPWLYIGSLAYALMTNFYIGYMLCIASVIFSFALMATVETGWKARGSRFGTFALASGIGGFAAAFSWLPTFFTLISGRGAEATNTFVWSTTFNILGLAGKLVAGSADAQQVGLGLPHVFCGIFTIVLVLLFFLNPKNRIRNRIIVMSVMAVLVVSFLIRGLDVIWHGFSPNNAFNFRYSFILSYVLLLTAQYAWEARREASKLWIFLAGGAGLALCGLLLAMKYLLGVQYISVAGLCISAVVVLTITLYLLAGNRFPRFAAAAITVVCLFEMGANYYISISEARKGVAIMDFGSYQNFLEQTTPAVEYVKNTDSGFYRMEKTFRRTQNDALLFGYNGLTHFSSSQDKAVPRFMKQLGMNNLEGIWSAYDNGSTNLVDSLFGVKYLLSRSDMTRQKGYTLKETVGDIGIYENPNALPIAMAASRDVLEKTPDTQTPFTLSNDLLDAVLGSAGNALIPVENWTVSTENMVLAEDGCTYVRENPDADTSVTYTLAITRAMPLYFYFTAPEHQGATLYLNGNHAGAYFDQYRWDVVYAGTYEPGDQVEITLLPHDQTLAVVTPAFCYEDLAAVSAAVQTIQTNPVQLQRKSSSHLTGSVRTDEDGVLLLTIPYEKGWQLTVDGEETPCTRALGLFLAAEIGSGEHTFQLRYIPQGSTAGFVISAAAVMALVLWLIMDKRKKQMP